MPRDPSIHRVLIIGSGPIVIGQACEFDYSGTQACRALRAEGIGVVLLNSNPATIMTDPDLADRTYIEPVLPEVIDEVLGVERDRGTPVDAILPTLGGQTGLNCAMAAVEQGILERHGVRLIGANRATIDRAEDRQQFKECMQAAGVELPRSGIARTMAEARAVLAEVKLPACIRPAYTLGGAGGGMARTAEDFERLAADGLSQSRISTVLIEEDLTGWKEYEYEMMRDAADNVVVVCTIENLDPMGVHTGDSITVAPAMTLSDREYQQLRDTSLTIMRAVGVETGGSNIQYAVDPLTGRQVVIEMNPRVSRSSALASKATGFPIAKIAAKLAIGYRLDEITNDITGKTPACFEPTIDYCVVKMPRFAFEKFPDADETLTTSMKSVGEAMAIGRTFKEAFQKCVRSMEIKRPGYGLHPGDAWLESLVPADQRRSADVELWFDAFGSEEGAPRSLMLGSTLGEPPPDWREASTATWPVSADILMRKISTPCQGRLYYVRYALKLGWTVEKLSEVSGIDRWFIDQLAELVAFEERLLATPVSVQGELHVTPAIIEQFQQAKRWGYSDLQLSALWRIDAETLDRLKARLDRVSYKLVDTCAAEFEAATPYYYSTHEAAIGRVVHLPAAAARFRDGDPTPELVGTLLAEEGIKSVHRVRPLDDEHVWVEAHDCELQVTARPKVIVLGGGPNRIGQGIEFDYCCVHAAQAARRLDYETVMVNSNPETVSTDYDVSDLLFFEPLTHEDVLNICTRLNGRPFVQALINPLPAGRRIDKRLEAQWAAAWQDADLGHGVVVDVLRRSAGREGVAAGYIVATQDLRLWQVAVDVIGSAVQPLGRQEQPEALRAKAEATIARTDFAPGSVEGVIVQFGGQTPLNLAEGLRRAGVPILGTAPENIHLAEDRERFNAILAELGLRQPANGIAYARGEAVDIAESIGYPVLVRPSYVLGGRGMCVCNNEDDLDRYISDALEATDRILSFDRRHPILVDKFLLDAIELDVDAIADFGHPQRPTGLGRCDICGVMEHIEEAGIHSGDSCCALPPYSLSPALIDEIKHQSKVLARRLNVCGLMNVQFAVQGRDVYVIEVNPRASRTIPFVSKATGVPWADIATKVMLGLPLDKALAASGIVEVELPRQYAVKVPVFPFRRFLGVDCVLGPEMRSTGEVMGIDESYPIAFAKALLGAGIRLPASGRVLVSVCDPDKPRVISVAQRLHELGFEIFATIGTQQVLADKGIPSTIVSKQAGDAQPFLLDLILERKLDLLINTPIHTGSASEEGRWRAASVQVGTPLITTMAGARAAVGAIEVLRDRPMRAKALQDHLAREHRS